MPADALVELRRIVRVRSARADINSVLARMGYASANSDRRERLRRVLADELLGMDTPAYDFRFDSEEFLRALCQALSIPDQIRESGLDALRDVVAHRNAFEPRLFVDTDFERANEPVFVLAMLENQRWIRFERAFRDLSAIAQIREAGRRAAGHFQYRGGALPVWGPIQRYRLYLCHDCVLTLDTQGKVVARARLSEPGRATFTLANPSLLHAGKAPVATEHTRDER